MKVASLLGFVFVLSTANQAFAMGSDTIKFCSIAANDDPVTKIFKRHFNDSDPVQFQSIAALNSSSSQWLRRACQSQVSCDVLIVNTELFQGGKQKDRQFPLKQILSGMGRDECPGILAKPVQVFFVGNNTLDSNSQNFFKDGKTFTPITEVYGFKAGKAPQKPMNEALEDFVSESQKYTQYLRTRMSARDQNCFHYSVQDVSAPKAIDGMDAGITLAWMNSGKVPEANRAIAATPPSPSCPKLSGN